MSNQNGWLLVNKLLYVFLSFLLFGCTSFEASELFKEQQNVVNQLKQQIHNQSLIIRALNNGKQQLAEDKNICETEKSKIEVLTNTDTTTDKVTTKITANTYKSSQSHQPTPIKSDSVTKSNATVEYEQNEKPIYAELLLYSGILSTIKKDDLTKLKKATTLFLKAYPKSVHADNILLAYAKLLTKKRLYTEALTTCDLLLNQYPQSHRIAASLLLKSEILKKFGKMLEANNLLKQIIKTYPGSPESLKIQSSLNIAMTNLIFSN